MLTVGTKAPLFTLPDKDGNEVSLADFAGKKVVLYFYPRDNTSGCTKQACAFGAQYGAFQKKGVAVIGVVFLPRILYLGLLSGLLKLGAAAAETLSESGPAEVMRSAAGAVSVMLSIVVCYAVMLLGALAMVLLARG